MENRPPMLTLKEVAKFLSLSEKTVYRLIQAGALPALKIGGQWRFDPRSLDVWVADAASKSNHLKQLREEGKSQER